MAFRRYHTGAYISELNTNSPCVLLNYSESTWELTIGFSNISREEAHQLATGDIRCAIAEIEGIIFFLYQIGDFNWRSIHYEPHLVSDQVYYHYDSGSGAPLAILIVDTTTGILMDARTVDLGPALSNRLSELCENLLSDKSFSESEYHLHVANIRQKYKTSADFLRSIEQENIFNLR